MAIVLPAPGGPVTVVSGPRAPSAMSLSIRGRGTTQPGRPGMVILVVRTGSSPLVACPFGRPGPRALMLGTVETCRCPSRLAGGLRDAVLLGDPRSGDPPARSLACLRAAPGLRRAGGN